MTQCAICAREIERLSTHDGEMLCVDCYEKEGESIE